MPLDKTRELTLTIHHRSDAGRVRAHNQDYLGYRQPKEAELRAQAGWLYVVADGVGGAQAGEVASKLAVQTLLAAYYHSYGETPADRLREAFSKANHAVHERASQQEGPHRMSTTLVAAVVRGGELTVANVGDSRAYLIRDGQIRQVTHDHSVVARLVAEGVITPEQAERHPQRHVISRSIGAREEVEADLFRETFHPGDRLLLCSDGLTEHVTDAEILAAMEAEDPETSVQRMVNLANDRGGTDNITVLVVRALREREERLPPQETEKVAVSRRVPWPWIGAIVTILLICVAGVAAGALSLLNPAPTPTPTATATPLPPFIVSTATATTIPTPTYPPTATPPPTATDTATPLPTDTPAPTDTPSPTVTETAPPAPTDTLSPTPTETASPTPTDTLSPTPTETTPPKPTDTPSPTMTETATPRPTEAPAPTPTATSTSETSPLPTPTATLTPTPTSTTEGSPLSTPGP